MLISNFDYSNGPFNLEKNQTFVLPSVDKLTFGLGWDVAEGSSIDLDGSVISFDSHGNQLDGLFYFIFLFFFSFFFNIY